MENSTNNLVCELCGKKNCPCGSAETEITEQDVRNFVKELKKVSPTIKFTKTLRDIFKPQKP